MKLGFIGLGKMGSRMVLKLLEEGHEVIVWNRSYEVAERFKSEVDSGVLATASPQNDVILASERRERVQNLKLIIAKTIEELVQGLEKSRVIWSMVPAGSATQTILDEVAKFVQPEDIVIDGGNAFYKDTEKRFKDLKTKGIRFLGIGVSGGIIAAENGYPLMVGGDKSAYNYIQPILDSLAKPHGGHDYFGEGGAGHFVKMVHNGIEYGTMQSIGEGFGVLEKAPYHFDLLKVAKIYQKGTLVSGFMLDRTVDALEKDPRLENIIGVINASGEAEWTVSQAREEDVPVEIIKRSLEFRRRSKTDETIQKSFAARMVAALRNAFGGHEFKKKP